MIVENESGVTIPTYLNEKFFKDTLENGYRQSGIVVNKITIGMGSNAGDNYCSSIYRVNVNFQLRNSDNPEEASIIVKTIPITSGTQFLEDVGVFMKEKSVYCDVLPRLEILLDNVKLGAKYFYSVKEPIQTIVFDDLKVHGFSTASRQDCLDFVHCKVLLERLGQLHGTSMVLAKKDPSILSKFQHGMLSKATIEQSETFETMFGGNLNQLAILVSDWPGFEEISDKLHKLRANFKVKTLAAGKPKPGGISVLNHGDLWTSNFMYSYDKEDPKKPNDLIFIDYQLSYFCSPGCDINFFLNSSVQYDVLVNQREELIDIYYQSLTGTLKSLNYPTIPTLKEIQNELREREAYGLFSLYGFLPIVTLDHEQSQGSSIEVFSDEEAGKRRLERIFANPKLHKYFKYALKRLDGLGVLDELSS